MGRGLGVEPISLWFDIYVEGDCIESMILYNKKGFKKIVKRHVEQMGYDISDVKIIQRVNKV